METEILPVQTFSEEEQEKMYNMYHETYRLAGQDVWFKTKEELFGKYPCVLTKPGSHLKFYIMFQKRTLYNKISLLCHDSSPEGKKWVLEILMELVKQPGWILEASEAVSWLLRKNDAPIITDVEMIKEALDMKDDPNQTLRLNAGFEKTVKESPQFYTRTFFNGTTTFTNSETLFGTSPCSFDNECSCDRKCVTLRAKKRPLSSSSAQKRTPKRKKTSSKSSRRSKRV